MSTPQPIRTRILKILLIPFAALVAMWGYNAYTTVLEVSALAQTQSRWQEVGSPVRELIEELRRERQLTAETAGRPDRRAVLAEQRRTTDDTASALRELVASIGLENTAEENSTGMRSLLESLGDLSALRSAADGGRTAPSEVIERYASLVDLAHRQLNAADLLPDVASHRIVRGLSYYSIVSEHLSREHALVTLALARGEMTTAEHTAFVAAATGRRLMLAAAERDMGPELRALHRELAAGTAHRRLQTAEDRLLAWDGSGSPPLDAAVWNRDAEAVVSALDSNARRELARVTDKGGDLRTAALLRIGAVVLLGLFTVVVSAVLSYRFGRSLVRELRQVRASAAELAEERLPRLVERLAGGEDVDPAAETPEPAPTPTAEVDGVVRALSAVRRTAVEAAVGQAVLRKGVGQVFLNLARRNQALLHRQLTLLDAMERRTEDPQTLEDLFKVDHLTTRMRRHAENLIVLSGAAPGRRWRDPVPVLDVVRGAVLEVEDYTRVTVLPMPGAPLLAGNAVTDVVHLIAELVENATSFSPPGTPVHVRGSAAAHGFAIEIEDRGLGLGGVCVDELNGRLARPPEFDPADSDRLGLFVVSRLAARHGIKVVLRPSPYDGATAIVMLPLSLLADPRTPADDGPAPLEAAGGDPGAPDDLDGLPVRVRQASLAPQLRRVPGREPERAPAPPARAPEEALARMSAMQRGWRQGRTQAGAHGGARDGAHGDTSGDTSGDPRNGKEGHCDGRPQI
ncbi:hypothetical protein GCM10010466_13990 [Planomonospora alba]|uniref:histidine kinase n=1 Tax=Planomonospora alba TaxID=161354 RepID=A0ABP6MTC1_9ACTN